MFRNYLVTALRNIARHRLSAVINIGGLALGLACVIVIALFIRDETSYDKWVPDSANIYRLEETAFLPGRPPLRAATSDFPLAALLKDNLPEVTAMTRFWPRGKTIKVGDRTFSQSIAEVDPSFFQVIRFPLVAGDPATVLSRPDAIVLSQSLTRKLFGDANPIGRTLSVNRAECSGETISCGNEPVLLRVSGIMADLPHNTHMRAEAIIPHTSPADTITEAGKNGYFNLNGYSYVKLAAGSDPRAIEKKIGALLDRHVDVQRDLGMPLQASKVMQIHLDPFSAVHLNGDTGLGNMVPSGDPLLLLGLGAIGLMILLIACFNFTNLATARAMARAREIGLRKCLGARRSQIITQFLGESVMTAVLALVLACGLVEMLLPLCARLLGRTLTLQYVADWPLLSLILAIAIVAGLLSGAYPALVLSRFRPALVLRTNSSGHSGSSRLRSALVVLQFAIAIGLAVATLVIFFQLDFVRHQALGFRRDNILVINTYRRMTSEARESFIAQLRRQRGILDVAASGDFPFSGSQDVAQMRLPGRPEYLTMHRHQVTPEFFRLYDMRLLAGRLLSDARGDDRAKNAAPDGNDGVNILINRAAATRFGFTPQGAVGQIVLFGPSKVRIVGVLADARIDGARVPPRATVYLYDPKNSSYISIRIAAGHAADAVASVEAGWRRFAPNVAIEDGFLDEEFERLYSADTRQGELFAIFVAIAIVIACLGLFGLAAFTVGQRTREIGIRKVFGANTADLTRMLLWQFTIPVLLANLIAWPLAWYYLHGWLQGFADRIVLNPLYFLAAGLVALAIAWLTVLTHAIRVARANPIHALRTE